MTSSFLPGDRWLHHGPCRYVPEVTVKIIELRQILLLDKNEGIYVQDTKTGEVRTLIGQSYLLEAHEELFEKKLDLGTERLIYKDTPRPAEKFKAIVYKCPFNSACQIYDYKTAK